MEELKQKSEPGMAFVGVLLLIVFGIMIFNDRPVQSPRPYDTPYPRPLDRNLIDHSYESWPWEDPFDFKPGELKESDLYQIEAELSLNEKQKLQIRLHKGLSVNDIKEGALKIDSEDSCGYQFNKNNLVKINSPDITVKILTYVVKIHPKTIENKENRTRQRYAVHAGLTASGYNALEPNRLNFCTSRNDHNKKYNVRWESFSHDKKSDEVIIVAWISGALGIEVFQKNLQEELWNSSCVSTKNNLKCITQLPVLDIEIHEKECMKQCLQKKLQFLPDLGWINNDDEQRKKLTEKLVEELKLRRIDKLSEITIISEPTPNAAKLTESFVETLKKDEKFFSSLTLCEQINNENLKNQCEIRKFSYFKGLDANQQAVKKRDKPDSQGNDKNWNEYFSLHSHENPPIGHAQFDYLHRLSHQIKDINKVSQRESHKNRIRAVGIFGSDFYDKLIILEALWRENPNLIYFTTDLDAQMLQPEYWNWTRNLIVASHFDLQLKDQFQKSFPSFRDSNQTEIYYQILKEFGNDPEIKETKPSPLIFEIGRNGPVYLHQENSCENNGEGVMSTRCFFSIPEPPTNNSIGRNYDQQNELTYYLLFVSLIAIVLIFTETEVRPFSGAQIIWLTITTFFLLIAMFFAVYNTKGEPLSFIDGVSVWPTILIRIFTVFLAFAFIIKLVRTIEFSFHELNKKDFLNIVLENNLKILFPNKNHKTFYEIIKSIPNFRIDPASKKRSFSKLIHDRLGAFIFFFTISAILFYSYTVSFFYFTENPFVLVSGIFSLLLSIALIPWDSASKGGTSFLIPVIVSPLVIFVICLFIQHLELTLLITTLILFFLLHHTKIIEIKSIRHWAEKNNIEEASQAGTNNSLSFNRNQLQQLWKDYRHHGILEQRLLRTTFMWLIFMNIDVLLRHLFPESLPLCRGDTCNIDYWIFILSYSIVMFLTFLVLDAQRLCIYWIEKLHTDYSKKSYNNQGSELIRLVADRTEVIDQLIYFPIILLMLMFLSRIVYFDYMDFPLSNGIISVISISLLFYAGLKLRTEASQLKWEVIENAKNQDKMIKELEQFNYGAFQPMSEQPVVRSALLLVGSLGLFAAEYLMLFGY